MTGFEMTSNNILGFCLIFVICLFVIFFSIGPGPLCYFIASELVGHTARSAAQSWASIVQMLSRFILVLAYLPLKNAIHSFAYLLLFIGPIFVSIVFLYYRLPETKN
ncbi:unnamed protein product, partial [Auanema sp. JU1783]